jgi:hypothetical protein
MAAIDLAVEQLLLDSENPRIGNAESQRDAMQKLIDDGDRKLFALAESVVSDGISPLERLLVMREGKNARRYITLDGNRRVAALKILSNPQVLGDLQIRPSLLKRFEELAGKFSLTEVEPIPCYEVADRDEAATWIYRRHTGEDQGRGVVAWSGLARARYRGRDIALQALEFVMKYGNLSDEQKTAIEESFPISTLKRLLSTPDVRKLLGVDVAELHLRSGLPADELIKPLKRIVLDLLEREIVVTEVKNVKQQVAYVQNLDPTDKPDLRTEGKMRLVDEILGKDFATPPEQQSRRKRQPADPSQRRNVIPSKLKLNFANESRPAGIFNELKAIRAEDAPNAGSVLLRVFLELSVDCYMEKHKMSTRVKVPIQNKTVDKKLKAKVREVVKHLVDQGGDERHFAAVVRGLDNAHSPFSIDLFNDYVHNRFVTPKPGDLMRTWDDGQRFFERLWA